MAFTINGGNVKDIFITEAEFVDQFVGNQLWAWGNNSQGVLGNNSTINRSNPVQTVSATTNWVSINSDQRSAAAIKTDGTLWVWGIANSGQLGNNSTVGRSSPVQTVSATTNWRQVASAEAFMAGVKTDGTLWTWGTGQNGRLGNNSTLNQSSPVQTVSATTNWKQVSAGFSSAAAIKTDGTLWLWGAGTSGQLGNNTVSIPVSSPVQTVSATTDWKYISPNDPTSAIKTDGTLWLWGSNLSGGLGTNNNINQSSPVQTVSATTDWKQIGSNGSTRAVIKIDGTLWVWGSGDSGILGTNSTISQSSPIQTVSVTANWKQVSVGTNHAAAIKTDGTLWLWGLGTDGRLGNNSTIPQSSPVQTVADITSWKTVSASDFHTFATTFRS